MIKLLLELIAAESFCNVGVIGTDGELVAGDVCGVMVCFDPGADGGDHAEEHQAGVAWRAESPLDGAVGGDDDGVWVSGGLQKRRD